MTVLPPSANDATRGMLPEIVISAVPLLSEKLAELISLSLNLACGVPLTMASRVKTIRNFPPSLWICGLAGWAKLKTSDDGSPFLSSHLNVLATSPRKIRRAQSCEITGAST